MTHVEWERLTPAERDRQRDMSGLTAQLVPWLGWRVEVVTTYGKTRRFIVGRSTGWRPCHIEVHNRRSFGGPAAESRYTSVRPLYRARP